jgi:hypothetical protein
MGEFAQAEPNSIGDLVAELVGVVFGVLVTNGLASLLVAYVAGQKGRSKVGFFWLAFFTSFLIGMLVVIAIPRLEEAQASQKRSYTGRVNYTASGLTVKCPLCAEWVSGEAKVCKHCGRDIADEVRGAIESERQAEDAEHRAAVAELNKRRAGAERLEEEKTRRERELLEEKRRKRTELFASKRFRVRALVGSGVALAAITAGTVFGLTSTAERTARLENLPERYLLAVDDCASSAGVSENKLESRYRIVDTTLVLEYGIQPGLGYAPDDKFVDCVISALTGDTASDINYGIPQERDFLTLSRSENGATLTVKPTP